VIVFAVAAVVTVVLALNDAGYDVVSRQQAATLVWSAIALGFAFGVLPRGRPHPSAIGAVIALAALAALVALSLSWTESDEATFEELARIVGYAGFVVLAYCALNRHTFRAAAAGLMAAALIVPALSIAARVGVFEDRAPGLFDIDRLSYPLGYWNAVACWSAIAIAIGLTWSAHARGFRERCLALAPLPIAGLAVYLSYSRAGVVAVAVAALAALVLSRNRFTVAIHGAAVAAGIAFTIVVARDQPEIAHATGTDGAGQLVLALLLAAGVCAAVAVATTKGRTDRLRTGPMTARIAVVAAAVAVAMGAIGPGQDALTEAWDEFRNERTVVRGEDPAARLGSFGGNRYDIWSEALDAHRSDRWRGIGAGSFEFYWSREGTGEEFLRDAHSLYLETLAELGLSGLALLLSAFGLMTAAAIFGRRQLGRVHDFGAASSMIAGSAVFAFFAGVDWMWELPAVVLLGLGGLAVAGSAGAERWGGPPSPISLRLAVIAIALVAILIQVPGLSATDRLRSSAAELLAGNTGKAAELANESVEAEPFAASPYVQRALVHEAVGDLPAAEADLEEAIERERSNWRHHLLLARVHARAGDRAEGRAELAEARRLAPRFGFLAPGAPFIALLEARLSGGQGDR
jgi:hypothetical protein